jgi:hypothetical protein
MIGGQREHYDSFIEAFSDFLKVFLKVKVPVKDFLNSVPVNGPKDFNTQNYEVTTKHTHTHTILVTKRYKECFCWKNEIRILCYIPWGAVHVSPFLFFPRWCID